MPPPTPTLFRRTALALALLAGSGAQAHQVWFEQDAQALRLYFGELAGNLRETSPGLLDKLGGLRARSVPAQGEAQPLALNRQAQAYQAAARVAGEHSALAQDDQYPLIEKKDGDRVVARTAWVPAARWVNHAGRHAPGLTLDLVPTGQPGQFAVFYQGQPLPKAAVEVVSPSGWTRALNADAQGLLQVDLPWQGLYALEVKHTDKAGLQRGTQRADTAMFVTTLSFVQAQGAVSPPPLPPAAPNR